MISPWQIQDLIDLEYFLAGQNQADSRNSNSSGAAENRRLYLEHIGKNPDRTDRSSVLKHWLNLRRQSEAAGRQESLLPGEIYRETIRIGGWIGFFAAFFCGAALAGSLLSYGGTTPVNVFTCLWVLLAPQLFLLAMLGAASFLSMIRPAWQKKGIYPVIAAILRRLALWIPGVLSSRMPAERQNQIRSALGLMGRTRTVYGGVFFWPVFNVAQITGIGFNIGILAALLLRITLTDVAFGWQSTLQPDPVTVHGIVEFIAAPWAWFMEAPWSHPTAAQIAGSKMVLKDGIYNLATADLASWWPFLGMSVIFYGLGPRVLLLGFGKWQQKKRLAGLTFTHSECDRLWLEMTAPNVQTRGRPVHGEKTHAPLKPEHKTHGHKSRATADDPWAKALVVVPQEAGIDTDALGRKIKENLGLVLDTVIAATGDPEEDFQKLIHALQATNVAPLRVVVVIEAWQPPIRENMAWIRQIRAAIGASAPMIIYLAGKPGKTGTLPGPPDQIEKTVWQQAVNSLADPYTRVKSLE